MAVAIAVVVRCVKTVHPSRISAARAARKHDRHHRTHACDSCRAGGRAEAYRCVDDPSHGWHWGHSWPARRRREGMPYATAD